jgi:hypothetical protein
LTAGRGREIDANPPSALDWTSTEEKRALRIELPAVMKLG